MTLRAGSGFGITLWFLAMSAGVIGLTMVALGTTTTAFLSDRFLQHEGQISQEVLEMALRAQGAAGGSFNTGSDRRNLEAFAGHILSMPGFLRANIYSPEGTVLWSSDSAMVGRTDHDNEELTEAFAGALITERGDLDHDVKPEHRALAVGGDRTFVEIYIPVRDSSGRIACVVEYYKSAAALNELVRDARGIVWSVAAAGALLLCATFFVIVRRGTALIRHQQADIANMEALATVGEMASAVAHNLRNPLASVRSSAELAKLEHGGSVAEDMTAIMVELDRLDQHISDLLNYARMQEQPAQRIDPKELVEGVLVKEARCMTRHGIEVALRDHRSSNAPIAGDPALLRQAIAGILANAVEAMPNGGRLGVRIETAADKQRIRIVFTDTGRGIPAEILARVFEPFFTTKPRGLGLGLALTRRIVGRCTGTVAIQSIEGRGTNVILDFAAVA
ncbi:MAG: ATP-binding protein [Dongiaceae bacterium]